MLRQSTYRDRRHKPANLKSPQKNTRAELLSIKAGGVCVKHRQRKTGYEIALGMRQKNRFCRIITGKNDFRFSKNPEGRPSENRADGQKFSGAIPPTEGISRSIPNSSSRIVPLDFCIFSRRLDGAGERSTGNQTRR